MTRFHGRMSCEYQARRREFPCFGERQLEFVHQPSRVLQRKECRVAFIHMEDSGVQAEGLQHAIPADAEKNLLPDTKVAVASIQMIRNVAIHRTVLVDVRVEQEKPRT